MTKRAALEAVAWRYRTKRWHNGQPGPWSFTDDPELWGRDPVYEVQNLGDTATATAVIDALREALLAAQHWLTEEAASPGHTQPGEILRVIAETLDAYDKESVTLPAPQKTAEELVVKLDASAVREALEKTCGSTPAVYEQGAALLDLLVSGGIHKIGELVRAEATVRAMLETIAVSHRLIGELREQNAVVVDAETLEREACVQAVEATPLKAHSTIGQLEACVAAILSRPVTGNIAVSDVLRERRRQRDKDWTAGHDDTHTGFELTRAAIGYLSASLVDVAPWRHPEIWPWDQASWKPGPKRRMLVKAAALIIAEIERLDRAEVKS